MLINNFSLPLLSLPLTVLAQSDLRALFESQLSDASDVYLPSDETYVNDTTQRWTTHGAPTFDVSVKPGTEEDVAAALRVAIENNMGFLATGGGHGYTSSYDSLDGGVQIDMSVFNSVEIDEEASIMTIGPGVLFRDVFDPVYEAGKEIQTGSCSCVGFIGATLGGGIGRYQGLHGLILDALLEVRVLIADGTILTASQTENSDFFWGIRGAGMNFGIILSATYQLHEQTNNAQVLNVDVVYPAAANETLFAFLGDFQESGGLPAELSIVMAVNWNDSYGGMNIVLNSVYIGPASTGLAYLSPILNSSLPELQPLAQNISTIPWNQLSAAANFGGDAAECEKRVYRNMYGLSVERIDVPTFSNYFAALADLMTAYPESRQTHWIVEGFPNAAARAIPSEASVYPHRDAFTHMIMAYVYPSNATALESHIDTLAMEARRNLSERSGDGKLGVYVSYGHGDEGMEAWYGQENVQRLIDLKREWDPEERFGWNNPVVLD